jgi:putative transposase
MRLTFKYRLFPTAAQRTAMQRSLDACRWVYNKTLEVRKEAWEERQESVSRYDTIRMLPKWKQDHPWLKQAYSQALQESCTRVDLAFQAFFRRLKEGDKLGYPRFKGANWYKSFTYPQSGFELLDSGCLRLSKIGDAKIKLHRPLQGEVKTLTVKRDWLGNWYACFSCEVGVEPLPPVSGVVGIDVGLEKFATLSTGRHIPNPRFFRKDEATLVKAQRRLSKCEKGTPEYRKRRRVVQHIHQRIANRRKDFAHKLSRYLADNFQVIAFEKLDILDMKDGNFRSMNKSIGDAAWNQLVQYTEYKAEKAGRTVTLVDPRGTSQECSGCGEVVRKDLSVRVHNCPHCSCTLDRDVNAALNILSRGLSTLAHSA